MKQIPELAIDELEDGRVQWNKIRKLSDLQMIRCVQEHSIDTSNTCYISKKPLHRVTLFFKDTAMEKDYRELSHRTNTSKMSSPSTLASAKFNTCLDIMVSALVFFLIAIGLSTLFGLEQNAWAAVLVLACLLYLSSLGWGVCLDNCTLFLNLSWFQWHILGTVILSLPSLAVLSNLSCSHLNSVAINQPFFLLMLVSLVHFCNFTQLNFWLKNSIAITFATIFLVCIVHNPACKAYKQNVTNDTNRTDFMSDSLSNAENIEQHQLFRQEVFIDIFLIQLLIFLLNREFEINYRLSFHGNALAAENKRRVQATKNQVDWLLHNIIPQHVAEQIKSKAMYSENHSHVGIIFASIVNFNEMYDESYLGGREYLRVLNELIGDFDELLQKPEFKNVEKIKTIGSTYMAASGLNPNLRALNPSEYHHLFELVEFARAMQRVVSDFNKDLLEFKLILRTGYNHGDVTAGVIGTTKLYYDIWGDAVNIASRMDSTGVNERIQIGESCLPELQPTYQFQPRGSIFVKGKDNMKVYLLKDSTLNIESNS